MVQYMQKIKLSGKREIYEKGKTNTFVIIDIDDDIYVVAASGVCNGAAI